MAALHAVQASLTFVSGTGGQIQADESGHRVLGVRPPTSQNESSGAVAAETMLEHTRLETDFGSAEPLGVVESDTKDDYIAAAATLVRTLPQGAVSVDGTDDPLFADVTGVIDTPLIDI